MNHIPRALVLLVLWLVFGVASGSGAATRIAILPFQNVSGHLEAPPIITPLISKAAQDRGYEVIEANSLEPFLARHRIRATEKIRREQLGALAKELGASLALVGSIDLFADTPGNPQWGLSGRLLSTDSGRMLWAGAAGYTGDDFTGFLELGTVTSPDRLAELVVHKLFNDFPSAGEQGEPPRSAKSGPSRKAPGRIFRDPRLDTEPLRRVAVLPFENATERRGAALIVDDLMITGLFRVGRFEVVDPGEVAHALQTVGVAPYGAIDLDSLQRIGEALGADAVILGRVDDYNEGLRPGTSTSPSIALDARMLETRTGKILWMGYQEGRGEEYQIVLEFGKIKSMVPLAMRVIVDLAETI
jgi:TolB-like protein